MTNTIRCRTCGHENPEDARFCAQCGSPLRVPCPVCGTEADPGDRFCRNCGSALAGEATAEEASWPQDDLSRYLPEELLAKMRSAREGRAMEGERRTVTMLFADIQGSTSAAEQLDPEDWAEIMNGAFERLIAPIYKYEGTLAQLRGDAVLAFFGAPIAHEDDPVRALRAGLEMVEAMTAYSRGVEDKWGIPAHVRVGINTGLVVVGAMGSDLRVEYTALGDAINTAARMEQTADPDTVRVTERTLSLTHGVFETEELGEVDVKGKTEPVTSHRVLRYVEERLTSDDRHPMVGRAEELDRLEEVRRAVLNGSGYVVSIIADAGVGKSRLVAELTDVTAGQIELATRFEQEGGAIWLSGSSRSYDAGRPFSTISEMLRRWWSTTDGVVAFSRVEEAVAAETREDPDLTAYLGYIAGLELSEPAARFIGALETRVLNEKANHALVSYVETLVGRSPVFVVLEDLHWFDDLSLALVEALMELTETGPLCLVMTMRPYRDEASWRIQEVADRSHPHRHLRLELEPLDGGESLSLLDALLEDEGVSEEIREGILDRSEGNPLYLEQMAMAVRELGAKALDGAAVPSSLVGLLTSRLDRLDEHSRYLAQVASVLGSQFDRKMLTVVGDGDSLNRDVTDLLRRGILREVAGEPGSLAFGHALIQEVAYETILKKTRRQLHRRVADHLIVSEGQPGDIAHHLVAAGDTKDAFPFLIEAGTRASRSMALADAIDLLTTALDNVPPDADPTLVQRAHEGLGEAYALIPDLTQSAASYQRLLEFGEENGRPSAQVAALNRLAYTTASLGADLGKAFDYLSDARRIAEEAHDDIGMAEYHMNACFVASMAGDPSQAVAHDEETVRLGEEQGIDAIRLAGLIRRAVNYMALLDFDRGLPAVDEALAEARQAGLEEAVAIVEFGGAAMAQLVRGEIRQALEQIERAYRTLERYESFYMALNRRYAGACLYELGEIEDALGMFVEVRRVATRANQSFTVAAGISGMALVYATAGIRDAIPELAMDAEELLEGPLGEFLGSTVLADLGFAQLYGVNAVGAAEYFERGLLVSSSTQFVEKPRLLAGQAIALTAMGDLANARDAIDEATALSTEKSLGVYRALLAHARGLHLAAAGNGREAVEEFASAQESAMQTGQRIMLVQVLEQRSQIEESEGRTDEARAHLDQARTVVEAIAAGIADEQLRSSFREHWLGILAGTPK